MSAMKHWEVSLRRQSLWENSSELFCRSENMSNRILFR